MPLLGAKELRSRMDAVRDVFQPVARRWAEDTVDLARTRVPAATGKTRASIRVRSATRRRAVVAVSYVGRFIEGGTKAHTIQPRKTKALKFTAGGQTVFARKAERRAQRARPFLAPSATQALDESPLGEELVAAWNAGA